MSDTKALAPANPKALRAAYQSFADKAAAFERETVLELRKRADADKAWIKKRKEDKAKLMAEKLAASVAMNEAEEAAAQLPHPAVTPARLRTGARRASAWRILL